MNIIYATDKNYKELKAEGFCIVDFYTTTCGPCKLLSRILEEVTADLPFVKIIKVNLSDYPTLGQELQIDAVPTIIFSKDGQDKERVVGLIDNDEIMEKIGKYYYE